MVSANSRNPSARASPRRYTSRAAAQQNDSVRHRVCQASRCTCAAAAERAGSWSASIHSDSALDRGRRAPATVIAARATTRSCARDDVAGELVVGAILDDELDLVVRRSRSRFVQSFFADFPAARALHVDDFHDLGAAHVDRR